MTTATEKSDSATFESAASVALQLLEAIRETHPSLIADHLPQGWGMNKLRQLLAAPASHQPALEETSLLLTPTVDQAAVADDAFSRYDFGEEVTVTDTSAWEYITPGNQRSRKVFVETEREDDGPAPRWKLTFTVRFDPITGALHEAYAIDCKGQIWGSSEKLHIEQDFTVLFEVSVTASSPETAAKFALADLRDTDLGPWTATITNSEGHKHSATVCPVPTLALPMGSPGSCHGTQARLLEGHSR